MLDMKKEELEELKKKGVKIHNVDATHGKIKIKVEKV